MRTKKHRLRRGLALATIVAALAAPAASAAPVDPQIPGSSDYERPSPYVPTSSPAAEPVATSGDGFDWGDAGIGAIAMLALAAIAGGATVAVGHRTGRGHTVA
jgi:hypothetical protein